MIADRNWLWTWSALSQLGLGLLTETNRNCNWNESLGGNRIAQLLHVEQSIAVKLLRALARRRRWWRRATRRGTVDAELIVREAHCYSSFRVASLSSLLWAAKRGILFVFFNILWIMHEFYITKFKKNLWEPWAFRVAVVPHVKLCVRKCRYLHGFSPKAMLLPLLSWFHFHKSEKGKRTSA